MEITKNSPRQQSCHTDSYTPVVTGSMRNRLRPKGIEAPRGACGSGGRILEAGRWRRESVGVPPTPGISVRADSKGLICTKIVQNPTFHVRAESKGVSGGVAWRV